MGNKVNKKPLLKKLLAVMLISAIVFALSGCIRYNATMKVGSDGSIDIDILYAVYDTSSLSDSDDDSSLSSGIKEDQVEALEEAGWKVKEYSKDSYKGYELIKKGIKAAELEEDVKSADVGFDKFSFTEKKGVYTLDWDVSNNTSEASSSGVDLSKLAEYGGYMKVVLELPNKPENSNATDTSDGGKTLEWDMFKMDEPIHCEFKITGGSGFPVWIIGVIIGGVIVAAGIVVAIILINKKKSSPAEPAVAAPYASSVTPSPVNPFPAAPQAPIEPQAPVAPQNPFAPQAPVAPQNPFAPQAPEAPQTPFAPQTPTGFPQVTPPENDTPSDPGAPSV
ncbi:MAG: hypothetical protein IKD90_01965 [Clostridiales bacterium]|nr:hypothetical protein [Clostridiales bacterium]